MFVFLKKGWVFLKGSYSSEAEYVHMGFLVKYCPLLTAASLRIPQQGGSRESVKLDQGSTAWQPLRATPPSAAALKMQERTSDSGSSAERPGSHPLSVQQPSVTWNRLLNVQSLPSTAQAELSVKETRCCFLSCGVTEGHHEPTILQPFRLSGEPMKWKWV